MAAYAIISGFKGSADSYGTEIARGRPGDMLRKLKELAAEPEAEYERYEVVHSRRGRIRRRKPGREAAVAAAREERRQAFTEGEPESVEPEAVEPEAVEPEAVEPEAVEPEAVEQEPVEAEAVEPEPVESEAVEPEAVEQEPVEAEAVEPEPVEKPARKGRKK